MITGPLQSSSLGKPNNQAYWNFIFYVVNVLADLDLVEQSETACASEVLEIMSETAKS